MARGKSIKKLLLDSSKAAFFAGIEIHNKPRIAYRYPTATILIITAWELLLKAYVFQYIGKNLIYERKHGHYTTDSIPFNKALDKVRDHINRQENSKNFNAIYENLMCLYKYRCSSVHFIDGKLDPVVFMVMGKSVLYYCEFIKKYFDVDISDTDNLIIMPIGLKLPMNPIDFLKQDYGKAHNEYVNDIIQCVHWLYLEGVQESIIIDFDIYAGRVNNIKNADIIAAIGNSANGVRLQKSVRITDDPNAPLVRVEPTIPPLRYSDLQAKVKEKNPHVRFNSTFNQAMKQIKSNPVFCHIRYHDPNRKNGGKTEFYTLDAVDKVIEIYEELTKTH